MTRFECGNRLLISGLESDLQDLEGLWTLAMDIDGNVLFNEGYPYFEQRGSENYMWWMWHGVVGHWVVNDSPGLHGDDRVKSAFGDFECPQDVTEWEVGSKRTNYKSSVFNCLLASGLCEDHM